MQTTATPLQPNSPVNRTFNKERYKRNEQSLDYVLRSGVAGGIAGCLVTFLFYYFYLPLVFDFFFYY